MVGDYADEVSCGGQGAGVEGGSGLVGVRLCHGAAAHVDDCQRQYRLIGQFARLQKSHEV